MTAWHCGSSTVARAEAGQRESLYDLRRLFEVVDAVGMPREALIPLLLGRSNDDPMEGKETAEMNINRRQFSTGLTGFAAAASLSHIQIPAKVDSAHMRHLYASVDELYM